MPISIERLNPMWPYTKVIRFSRDIGVAPFTGPHVGVSFKDLGKKYEIGAFCTEGGPLNQGPIPVDTMLVFESPRSIDVVIEALQAAKEKMNEAAIS